ncbi:FANCD2 opposite strand protein [Mantella aurantiaca]
MALYQLWSPWTPLDESLQWLRRATPQPKVYRGLMTASNAAEFKLTRLLGRRLPGRQQTFNLAAYIRNRKMAWPASDVLVPRPICLCGLDTVFDRLITVQPPKWSGAFHVSGKSAFSKVMSRMYLDPLEQISVDMQLAIKICRQLLYAILLLYTTYKKCVFTLEHGKGNPARNDQS